eukprot:TRINITY_DN18448_c0_g1_i1.p1 TRINITY_DN18448_c0_g1~~TRINITY_DN18448_c0_g1_i1.p1  ORF type:complete len:352 (+),score=43.75 TRINITY_DN18448_c0_g1_i1:188-1243(+)
MAVPYQLIGCEHSYFTGKVRAYLQWKGLPFQEVLSTMDVFKSTILPKVGWAVIPVLVIPGDATHRSMFVQDTADIIGELERRHPHPAVLPILAPLRIASLLIELLADQWLVLPAMHYRWQYPEHRAWLEREWGEVMAPSVPAEGQTQIAAASMKVFANAARFVGASPETAPAIEASFQTLLGLLSTHLAQHLYLLGGQPSLADFAMMGPLYAHIYRDPASGVMLRCKAPLVARWVERVMCIPRASEFALDADGVYRSVPAPVGELLGSVPETLMDVIQHMLLEYMPILKETVNRFVEAELSLDEEVPRALGILEYHLGGVKGTRGCMSFDLHRAQRVILSLIHISEPTRPY